MNDVKDLRVSLVIPMKNESDSLAELISSIERQTFQPAEIILVDGGSTDGTVELAESFSLKNPKIKLIKTPQASPGKGRNIGIESAMNEWIALTDAGILLENDWLKNLETKARTDESADIVYGNFAPVTKTFFEKCAAIAYVSPLNQNGIRGKSIASCLLKKEVWQAVGGFPDLRAAEDLMFMEAVEKKGFRHAFAPQAQIHWYLRPDLVSTFRKFVLYSKYNVWANRQWDWHYGIVKQYLFLLPFIILIFLHSRWWLLVVPFWLFARTLKRILPHRAEFGSATIFNPAHFFSVMFLILSIDMATFIGWGQAVLSPKS